MAEAQFLMFNRSITSHKPIIYLCGPGCSGFEHVPFVLIALAPVTREQIQNSTAETKAEADIPKVIARCFRSGGLCFLQFILRGVLTVS